MGAAAWKDSRAWAPALQGAGPALLIVGLALGTHATVCPRLGRCTVLVGLFAVWKLLAVYTQATDRFLVRRRGVGALLDGVCGWGFTAFSRVCGAARRLIGRRAQSHGLSLLYLSACTAVLTVVAASVRWDEPEDEAAPPSPRRKDLDDDTAALLLLPMHAVTGSRAVLPPRRNDSGNNDLDAATASALLLPMHAAAGSWAVMPPVSAVPRRLRSPAPAARPVSPLAPRPATPPAG